MANDPAFAGLVVSADDPRWAQAALATPRLRELVLRATYEPSGRELRTFALRPGAVRLTRRYFKPDAAVSDVAPMVALLAEVAAEVERLPPPARVVALSSLEAHARRSPTRLASIVVLGVMGLLLSLSVIAVAAALLLES
jgi:hypothetical protein